jgi:hypothetical protein
MNSGIIGQLSWGVKGKDGGSDQPSAISIEYIKTRIEILQLVISDTYQKSIMFEPHLVPIADICYRSQNLK